MPKMTYPFELREWKMLYSEILNIRGLESQNICCAILHFFKLLPLVQTLSNKICFQKTRQNVL